jgi:hypothetical protein
MAVLYFRLLTAAATVWKLNKRTAAVRMDRAEWAERIARAKALCLVARETIAAARNLCHVAVLRRALRNRLRLAGITRPR